MRYLAFGALLGAAVGFVLRAMRGTAGAPATEWPRPAHTTAGAATDTVAHPGPVAPVPPAQADPVDREIESRLDDESKYDRFREAEERERAAVAARLQEDPLTERLEAPADAD